MLTGGLDLVALVLAVVFFRGLRAPAWLVLPPMWLGAGLLGQILVAFPVILLTSSGPSSPGSGQVPPLADWVYLLVYGGFAGLGIGLLGAFAVYAWQRWGQLAPEPGGRSGLASGSAGTWEVVESVLRLVAGITGGLSLVLLATHVRARDAGWARPAAARTTSPARPGR